MRRVDISKDGVFEMAWSPDSKHLTYVRDEDEIRRVELDGEEEPRIVAKGSSPSFNADNDIIFEREDEIHLASGGGTKVLVSKGDVISDTAKRKPRASMDGKSFAFVIDNVFHKDSQAKNAYPYRSFLGLAEAQGPPKPRILGDQQWYGGVVTWMPEGDGFMHYEYDSTGGARIHIVGKDGQKKATMFGLYPSISPDMKRIACKPKGGQNVVVYSMRGDTWDSEDLDTVVCKLPEGGRLSGSPPIWLDNRSIIIDEGGKLFRVDTRKREAQLMKKVPTPTMRGGHTMVLSPSREWLALEVETGEGFELGVVSLA